MGTRGYFAFFYKGRLYIFYNQFDSYISGLGTRLLHEVREMMESGKFDDWKRHFASSIVIENEEQFKRIFQNNPDHLNTLIDHFIAHMPTRNIRKCDTEYSDITRLYDCCQSMKCVLESKYLFITEDMDFMYEAEYGYILDFDKERFKVKILGYNCTLDFSLHNLPYSYQLPEIAFTREKTEE